MGQRHRKRLKDEEQKGQLGKEETQEKVSSCSALLTIPYSLAFFFFSQ